MSRDLWVKSNGAVLPNNREYLVLDDEQGKDYQDGWDGEFGIPKDFTRYVDIKHYLQSKLDTCFCDDVGQYPLCEQCRVIRKLLGEV